MKRAYAVLAAISLLGLAHAEGDKDGDRDNRGAARTEHEEHHNEEHHREHNIPVVPEMNPFWILVSVMGAILFWHWSAVRKA